MNDSDMYFVILTYLSSNGITEVVVRKKSLAEAEDIVANALADKIEVIKGHLLTREKLIKEDPSTSTWENYVDDDKNLTPCCNGDK